MPDQNPPPSLSKEAQSALVRVLRATLTLPAQITFYASALGAIALASQADLSPVLATIAAGVGVNALSSILERIARGKPVADDEIRTQVLAAIEESRIEQRLADHDTQRLIAGLYRRHDVLRFAVESHEHTILERLTEQGARYEVFFINLQGSIQALHDEVKQMGARQRDDEIVASLQWLMAKVEAGHQPALIWSGQIGVAGDHAHIAGGVNYTTINYQQLPLRPVDEVTLTAAHAQLAAMPLDTIPDLAPLPPGSRMPYHRNPLFVGRECDLMALACVLQGGHTAAIGQIAAATGLGGIGKTQLASEFVHRYGQFFAGGVFWLSFADLQGVPAEVAACGGPGYLDLRPDFATLPIGDQVKLVQAAWCNPLPRLLVFDNCEEETLLAEWRPSSGGARVLVTSRRGTWSRDLAVNVLPLGVLSRDESIALLRKYRDDLGDDEAETIAEDLGDLPLALHLAGSFLDTYRHDPPGVPLAYLDALRQEGLAHRSLAIGEKKTVTTSHERHVARTFALSYERLDADDPVDAVALALLARASFFAPGEPIPRALLIATLELEEDDSEGERWAEDGLARLVGLGLLDEQADGRLVLHRLLSAFVRGVGADDAAQEAVEETLWVGARRLNKAGYPAPLLAWQLHLRTVVDMAAGREDERAAGLCNELGHHLKAIGDYHGARRCYERVLEICEQVLGPDHPNTAATLNNLGTLLCAMGDLAGARLYLERTLTIAEQVLGFNHPHTATSLNNLGSLLQSQGDLVGARSYLERALAINEMVLGPDHPDTANSLSNLGLLLQAQGDLAGARPYLERALAIRKQVLGLDHPDTALSLSNLGLLLLQALGDLAGARPYLERALAIRERVFGPDHPDTAQSLNSLGMLLVQAQDDLARAQCYLQRALEIREKVLGPDHPDTAQSLNNLGYLLVSMGDMAGARPYYERALAIREQVLGRNHPDTAISLNNLGYLLVATGDLAEAQPYYERALAIREQVLGPDHPNTAQSRNNLGYLLGSMGDLAGARPYYERALAVREQVLGPEHPDTQHSRRVLARIEERLRGE